MTEEQQKALDEWVESLPPRPRKKELLEELIEELEVCVKRAIELDQNLDFHTHEVKQQILELLNE